MKVIAEAAKTGEVQVLQGEPSASLAEVQAIDLHGSGLRDEILRILERHGVDADPSFDQEIDAGIVKEVQAEILDAVARAT